VFLVPRPRRTCPGDFGPHKQLLADADWRADAYTSAGHIARENRWTG
jgi:hypothetical protein